MTILQFNKPAISIPTTSVDSIIAENSNLLRIILKDKSELLSYKVIF